MPQPPELIPAPQESSGPNECCLFGKHSIGPALIVRSPSEFMPSYTPNFKSARFPRLPAPQHDLLSV